MIDANGISGLLKLAQLESEKSLDPSTKTGCVITNANYVPISYGHNHLPDVNPDYAESILSDRKTKYPRIIHAEQDAAIHLRAGNPYAAFVYPFPPCLLCASILADIGVREVYAPAPTSETSDRWHFDDVRQWAVVCGIILREV